jgi:hypothetical protein
MKKSDLLRALQTEIQKHNLSTFMDEKDRIVITGWTFCRKHFGTVEQFKRHITDDVLPPLLDRLSSPEPSSSQHHPVVSQEPLKTIANSPWVD